jgi:thiol-disulfide isomerase/thioredoxin
MVMIGTHRFLGMASIGLVLALAVAACGGDADSADAGPEPAGALETPAEAAAPGTEAAAATAGVSGVPAAAPTETAVPEPSATPAPEPTSSPPEGFGVTSGRSEFDELAPELAGLGSWINSEPFTLESQRGNVVLIDFWTYTCVNCIRTLPYLKEWHAKYAEQGLVILGVHTPEFEFEKIRANVIDAMEGFGIEYPVAQDNDFGTWRAFENRFWPAKYLIDKDGFVRYTHFGEGAYDVTEEQIRDLLSEAGSDLSTTAPNTDSLGVEVNLGLTRELYAGTGRNYSALMPQTTPPYVLHSEFYEGTELEALYQDPGIHQNHFLFLNGLWMNTEESLIHARETEGYDDYIVLQFFATSVNVVMASTNDEPVDVRITMDGKPMLPERSGADIKFDDDGNSYVRVDESRMYRIVDMDVFDGHELKLSSTSPHMEVFAFTFGSYAGGEPESSTG